VFIAPKPDGKHKENFVISRLHRTLSALAGVCLIATAAPAAESAKKLLDDAVVALGGAAQVNAVRNISLAGYAQYAYMMGGGRIDPSPEAPEKYIAANALHRVYDIEHDRFEIIERRNMLFPFLGVFGHNYALNTLVLDGDVAYDLQGPDAKPVRVPRWTEGVLWEDGVHMRRMWMLNNPVALIRRAQDPGTKCALGKHERTSDVLECVLKEGDKFKIGFGANHRPDWVRWSNPQTNLGEVTYTTYFSGYASVEGLMLPLGYDTRFDWRNVDYFKLYVDHYGINEDIGSLEAPAAVKAAAEPPSNPVRPVTSVSIAPHIWRLTPGGTSVIEFKDHLTLFELGTQVAQAHAIIEYARTLVPGKPVTQLITTHNHFDHLAGLREAVAEGLTVIARRENEPFFKELATHPDPDFPDHLANSPKPLKFIPVDEKLHLGDESMSLDVYWSRKNIHTTAQVFAYAPAQRVIFEGDIATAAFDYQFWPDDFDDLIKYYNLDPVLLSPVHSISQEHPDALTMPQIEDLIRGGTKRARERCESELAKGNYFPGCPVWSKRY
jgi:glyoxylase-like metal-dependent hydrolase (beta-lactamase superfamily II)